MANSAQTLTALLDVTFQTTNPFFTSDMTVSQALQLSQRKSLVSKYVDPAVKVDSATPAIALFMQMNDRCKDSFVLPDGTDYIDDLLYDMRERMRKVTTNWDGPRFSLADACCRGLPGPGASAGVSGTDFLSKLSEGQLTYSDPKLYAYYCAFTGGRWRAIERSRRRVHGDAVYAVSEVFTVPKKTEIDRVALKEPSLSMYFQKGLGVCVEDVLLEKFRISLKTQPNVNRKMARVGSLTGRFATIDLKSASDTISTAFIKWLLPPEVYSVFDACRSKVCDRGELHMFSSMGNGFTFPLQTLVFSVLVNVAYQSLGLHVSAIEDGLPTWSVFGDDIIVRREAYHRVTTLLSRCGFIVNDEKSYNEGPFRESCGRDFFRGHDVRGVYLKKDLRVPANLYSAFNRLHRWSLQHGVNCAALLQHLFGQAKFQPVPFDAGDTAGHHWPRSLVTNRKEDSNGADYYRATRAIPRRMTVDRCNNDALFVAAVGGYLACEGGQRTTIGLRSSKPRWKIVREVTPSWDYLPYVGLTIQDYTRSCLLLLVDR